MSEKNGPPENVIKGPWPGVIISNVDGVRVVEDLNFADDLTDAVMVQMVSTLKENDFDTSSEQFSKDIGFTLEVIKSIIYRSMGYEHPLHGLMGNILKITEISDGKNTQYDTSFNLELLNQMTDLISANIDEDGPDLA